MVRSRGGGVGKQSFRMLPCSAAVRAPTTCPAPQPSASSSTHDDARNWGGRHAQRARWEHRPPLLVCALWASRPLGTAGGNRPLPATACSAAPLRMAPRGDERGGNGGSSPEAVKVGLGCGRHSLLPLRAHRQGLTPPSNAGEARFSSEARPEPTKTALHLSQWNGVHRRVPHTCLWKRTVTLQKGASGRSPWCHRGCKRGHTTSEGTCDTGRDPGAVRGATTE